MRELSHYNLYHYTHGLNNFFLGLTALYDWQPPVQPNVPVVAAVPAPMFITPPPKKNQNLLGVRLQTYSNPETAFSLSAPAPTQSHRGIPGPQCSHAALAPTQQVPVSIVATPTPAQNTNPPQQRVEEQQWARDLLGRLRTKAQFQNIFGKRIFEMKWEDQVRKHGTWHVPREARISACYSIINERIQVKDTNLPSEMRELDYSNIPGVTNVPNQCPRQALAAYLRHHVPEQCYNALAELYSSCVHGKGSAHVVYQAGMVGLDVSACGVGQVIAIRCWAARNHLCSTLEVDPITRKIFLTVRKPPGQSIPFQ